MPRQQMRLKETNEQTGDKDGGSLGAARTPGCAGSTAECGELALPIQEAAEAAFVKVTTALKVNVDEKTLGLVVANAVFGAMQAASTDEKQPMAVAAVRAAVMAVLQKDAPLDKLRGVVANAVFGAMQAAHTDEKQPMAVTAVSAAVRAALEENIPKGKPELVVFSAVGGAIKAAPAGQEQAIAAAAVKAAARAAVEENIPESKLKIVVYNAVIGAMMEALAGQKQSMAVAVVNAMVKPAVQGDIPEDKLGPVVYAAALGAVDAASPDEKQPIAVAVVNAVEVALKSHIPAKKLGFVVSNTVCGAVEAAPVNERQAMAAALAPFNPIGLARGVQIQAVDLPVTLSSAERKSFYSTYLPLNYIVVATHVFSLPETQFAFDQKQTARSTSGSGEQFSGESSYDNLMLDEFKASFSRYQQFTKSRKVDDLMLYVNRFTSLSDMEISRLQLDEWQPIFMAIETAPGSGHAISLLTDSRALLLVDTRAFGIAVLLIKRKLDEVQAALRYLQGEKRSQKDTLKAIFALFFGESVDEQYAKRVLIPAPRQTIDNCGWAQAAGMLKALVVAPAVRYFSLQGKLPVTNSKKWRKALKDADDIYERWQKFDQTIRLEAMTCLADQTECNPILLNETDQAELERQRGLVDGEPIIGQQLLERIAKAAAKLDADPACLRLGYKESVHASATSLALLAALGSEMGQALQKAAEGNHAAHSEAAAPNSLGDARSAAKALLRQCQNHDVSFDYLSAVHQEISLGQFSQNVALMFAATVELACVKQATQQQVEAYLTAVSERCAAVTDVGTGFEKCVKEQAALIEANHTSTMHGHGGTPNQDAQPGATLDANESASCPAGISAAADCGLVGQVNGTGADKF